MSKKSTTKIADDTRITQVDIDSGQLVLRKRGAGGAVLPIKRRINIFLNSATLEYFKAKAGGRGFFPRVYVKGRYGKIMASRVEYYCLCQVKERRGGHIGQEP